MGTKHTKGKWHPVEFAGRISIHDGPHYEDLDVLDMENFEREEVEANAKLIAAAPQMLEALIEAQETIQSLKLSMLAHPDCEEGSEFDDLSSIAEETENLLDLAIKLATE